MSKRTTIIDFDLRTLRNEFGLSQREFGKMLGIPRSYVSMLETGSRNINDKLLHRIIEVFNVDIKYHIER